MSTRTAAIGNVRLDLIEFHPHNVRVDLGDLRSLTRSIKDFGLLTPVVLEQRGDMLRVRNGHRRVAAARLAGLKRVTAVVHPEPLEDDEWLRAAVHENTRRRDMNAADTERAIRAMHDRGLSICAIADDVSMSTARVRKILNPTPEDAVEQPTRRPRPPVNISAKRLRIGLDSAREAVVAGELDAWGVLSRIEALLPAQKVAP